MKMRPLKTSLSFLFVLLLNQLDAQSKFSLKITFPDQLNLKNVSVSYSNGKKYVNLEALTKHALVISDSFFTKYAEINISYSGDTTLRLKPTESFFVGEKPATIRFIPLKDHSFSLSNVQLNNAINALDLGKREMDEYTYAEKKKYFDLVNSKHMYDSLVALSQYGDARSVKELEFVTQYPNYYYSLWCLREIAPGRQFSADSILQLFRTKFSLDAQNSPDGMLIRQILSNRTSTKEGSILTPFTMEDIDHKNFTIGGKSSGYKLLVFWGTWCAPCIAELPIIKEFSSKYAGKQLEIFGLTVSDHMEKVVVVDKKFGINWHVIFNDENVLDLMRIGGTPETILIDPEGKIVYRNAELGDYGDLPLLRKYLKEHLKEVSN